MHEHWKFRVELAGTSRPLWREFLIAQDASFEDLHDAIQEACGWEGSHLFLFMDGQGKRDIAGVPDPEDPESVPDAESVDLSTYFHPRRRKTGQYVYDFGDWWVHKVRLCEVKHSRAYFFRRLTGGEGTFPPEDCGSVEGYERCVAALTGAWRDEYGDDAERDDLLGWLGGWRPDQFELSPAKRAFDR
jgi:hypothetical protein